MHLGGPLEPPVSLLGDRDPDSLAAGQGDERPGGANHKHVVHPERNKTKNEH